MKPAWDRLATTYARSDHVIIGDADCTASGQKICQKVGVKGYPTIKYYVDGIQRDYRGGRDFDALNKFVEKNLGPPPPPCEVSKKEDTCSSKEIKFIDKFEGNMAAIEEEAEKLNSDIEKKSKGGKNKKFVGHRWIYKRLDILNQLAELAKSEL